MKKLTTLFTIAGLLLTTGTIRAAAPKIRAHNSNLQSYNWSGYVVNGTNFTDVKGSWVVPSAVPSAYAGNTYSSTWIGLDGNTSNTVEQLGTESDYNNVTGQAVYYSWFECYPFRGQYITGPNDGKIAPGDIINAEVSYQGGNTFKLYIENQTQKWSFTTYRRIKAQRTSAEWIVEAPYNGGTLPLANFQTVTFSNCYANNIGLSSLTNAQPVTMVSDTYVKAFPSAVSNNGFSDIWQNF